MFFLAAEHDAIIHLTLGLKKYNPINVKKMTKLVEC